ncbi:zinc finger protein 664-like [Ochlerotatus camptorhynchus]|uniref:zinc finger protein 664-like n=1 Tax=Ochlerotatus camptorhynchus TaxID=644619 RepID=UPI0031E0F9FC
MSAAAATATAVVSNVCLVGSGEEETRECSFPATDGESVVWKEILVEEDFLEDNDQFVDFVLLEDELVLDLIDGENERQVQCTVPEENEIDSSPNALCNKRNAGGWHKQETPNASAEVRASRKDETTINIAQKNAAFKCGVCLLLFRIKAHLIRHMLLRHRQADDAQKSEKIYSRCLRCNELYGTTVELESHLKEKHRTTLSCDICLRLFDDKNSLDRHRQFHAGTNPFTCDVCNKQCKNSSHLHFHRRSHFTKDLGYRCKHCNRQFSSSGNCQKHIARVHTLEKRYKCSNCPESFVYPRQLKIHQKQAHPSQKHGPHDCTDCDDRFNSKQELSKHRNTAHYQKDRPHACDQCPSRFKQLGHLKTHKLTHSGAKPFACDRCEKRFRTGTDLKVHQRGMHSKEKPFRCEDCGKAFIVGYLLNQHRIKVHGDGGDDDDGSSDDGKH